SHTTELNGWKESELLSLLGVQILLGGFIHTFIQPNMELLMQDVQQGTLDYALTKPEDAQILISVRQVRIWQVVEVISGLVLLIVGLTGVQSSIGAVDALAFTFALGIGGVLVYCFWLILTIGAFWVVRMEHVLELGFGLLAATVAVIGLIPTLRAADWSLTTLPRVGANTAMAGAARAVDPGFHTVRHAGYDGQFYWGIGVDPLATGHVHHFFDKASYRYGHPLYGWLGWLFSAGQARAVPGALVAIGLASLFVAATTAAALGFGRGRFGWEGLFVALNPGLISSAVHDLAEPLATALLLGAFAAYARDRRTLTWICLALVPLSKEPLLVVLLAIVGWELHERRLRRAAIF